MKKVFIFFVCGECDEPISILHPCDELGYNAFGQTNFHGELSLEETEELRLELIQKLKDDNQLEKAKGIELNTKVFEIEFKID